jgi:hypothetical protein
VISIRRLQGFARRAALSGTQGDDHGAAKHATQYMIEGALEAFAAARTRNEVSIVDSEPLSLNETFVKLFRCNSAQG